MSESVSSFFVSPGKQVQYLIWFNMKSFQNITKLNMSALCPMKWIGILLTNNLFPAMLGTGKKMLIFSSRSTTKLSFIYINLIHVWNNSRNTGPSGIGMFWLREEKPLTIWTNIFRSTDPM